MNTVTQSKHENFIKQIVNHFELTQVSFVETSIFTLLTITKSDLKSVRALAKYVRENTQHNWNIDSEGALVTITLFYKGAE